jgi:hypothetical protein
VLWSEENYLTFFDTQKPGEVLDQGHFVAVASLPINSLAPRSIVLTPDGADVIGIFWVAATSWDGRIVGGSSVRVVERWNLATRTRLWSRTLPAIPNVPELYGRETDDLVTLGPHGLFATRCMSLYEPSRRTYCHIVALDAHTGALGPAEVWSSTEGFTWSSPDSHQVSAGRRYTLIKGHDPNGRIHDYLVFDDRGRMAGRLLASCARFAEGGSEEMPSILIDEQAGLAENAAIAGRFHLIKDASACQPEQYLTEARKYQSVDDRHHAVSQYDWIGGGRRIVWISEPYATSGNMPRAYSMDIDRVGLPAPLPAPPGTEDTRMGLTGSGSDLYAQVKTDLFHLEETGFVRDSVLPQPGRFVSRGGDDALMVDYNQGLWLAKRRPDNRGFTWQKSAALSTFTPAVLSFEDAGRPQMLVAGGYQGLQWVDMRTGQVFRRSCSLGAPSSSACDARGLVMSSARQTAFTMHQKVAIGFDKSTFDEIELSTGKLRRSFPAPAWNVSLPLDLPMGWLEKERRFWIAGMPMTRSDRANIMIVTIPATDGAEPHYESFSAQAAAIMTDQFGVDPDGRFFVFGRVMEKDMMDVFAPDGTLVLTMSVRSDGVFAQARDGRFACTGSACDELRCVVGNVARQVTDPTCATFRVEGFSILEELARAQQGREAGKAKRSQ